MAANDELLALAEELDGVSIKDDCDACLASGTSLCRGDLECAESAHKACAKRLREIVEHDAGEVATVSAYDLLPEEDREALAWVCEYGGLDLVKAFVHQGAVEHGFLLKIVEMLGTSIYDGSDNADDLLAKISERLMPEGMEWLIESWPRFDDNEPARWEDEYENGNGNASPLHRVSLRADGVTILGKGRTKVVLAPGERVKRPAPKVLDADGVEVGIGDKLYETETGRARIVRAINANGTVEFEGYENRGWLDQVRSPTAPPSSRRTASRLRVGETVYKLEDSRPYTVKQIDGDHVYINAGGKALDIWTFPGKLTHEQPDSWERIEDGIERGKTYTDVCVLSIVRRCRALAERGER